MNYLNDTSSVNFKGLMKNNKELSKKWFRKLKELVNEFLDSDIPYDVENINKELFKTKTLKEMMDILYREIDSSSRRDINDELNDIFRFNTATLRMGGRYTLFNRRQDRASERNKTANIKAVGMAKIKEIIRFNAMRDEICDLILQTGKKYGIKTGEAMNKLKEKKTKLQNQLKKELKNFENPLRFLGSMCSLDDLPKGLQKIVDDKLFNKDNKKIPFGGQINELKSRAWKIFNVTPESLESKNF
jgi:predicted house-cleaning noncanonical NTP pyrophosphatase (MazG superfamily)